MFRFLASLFALQVTRSASAEAERQYQKVQSNIKRLGTSLFFLHISAPLFLIGIGLILTGLFLKLAHLELYIMPSIWTGLTSLGGAILFVFASMSIGKIKN